MQEIDLKAENGEKAKVDGRDYNRLKKWEWRLNKSNKDKFTASVSVPNNEGNLTVVEMHRFLKRSSKDEWVVHKDDDGLNNQRANLVIVDKGRYWRGRFKEDAKKLAEVQALMAEKERIAKRDREIDEELKKLGL